MKIIILGPAHPLRGGLASFNERLATTCMHEGWDTIIYTFALQYPNFLFPGTTQYSSEPAPNIAIKVCINSINPFNWIAIGRRLKKLSPDIIVVRYWMPFMAPCLGTILRIVKKNKRTKIICIADNISPHENRIGDKWLTRYFISPVDSFITMSKKVMDDLRKFTNKPAQKIAHPLYDGFGDLLPKTAARKKLGLAANGKIILFFGFIRDYKGLDILLHAMKYLVDTTTDKNNIPKLLVAGEFYTDKKMYDNLIESLGIAPYLLLHTKFIADSDIKYYFSAADFVIQPYRSATQSGVTPLAYHFEKPMLVTNVGSLPDAVADGKIGVVAEANATAVANGILRLYELGEDTFLPNLRAQKKTYTWKNLLNAIATMSQ